MLPAAFLTVSVAVTRSENRAATTSSSFAPSPFGDRSEPLRSSDQVTVGAESRGARPVART